jgi:PAS domain S-box-containing protein
MESVDALATAMIVVSPDGEVLFANARASELFPGHLASEGRALGVAEVLAPLDELLATQRAGAEQAGRSVRRPLLRVGHDGVERVFGYTVSRAKGSDAAPWVIAFQDVTQVVQLEEERDRLLKLATVGEVMPMLLHETKNPLAAAITTLELLLEERSEPALQADLHGVLVEIRRALLSLEGLAGAGRWRGVCHRALRRARRGSPARRCEVPVGARRGPRAWWLVLPAWGAAELALENGTTRADTRRRASSVASEEGSPNSRASTRSREARERRARVGAIVRA